MWPRSPQACRRPAALLAALFALLAAAPAADALPAPQLQGELRQQAYQSYREDPIDIEEGRPLETLGAARAAAAAAAAAGGGGRLLARSARGGLDSLSGVTFGGNKRFDPLTLRGDNYGSQKRNFDEIDRIGFNGFVKKNFDEIDRTGFDSFVKRNFDEIDRVGFGSFVKRNAPHLLARYYERQDH